MTIINTLQGLTGNQLFMSALVVGGIGFLLGIILAYASRKLSVKKNETASEIEKILPGANCGACGYAGCEAYAKAVAEGKVSPGLCKPGGDGTTDKIKNILKKNGIDGTDSLSDVDTKNIPVCMCLGGKENCKTIVDYKGVDTCSATDKFGGDIACTYGCLGRGDCASVCPVDAIKIDKNGLPSIDYSVCINCGKCAEACPRELIKMVPEKSKVHIKCFNQQVAKDIIKICKKGCIACGICVKNCPVNAISINNNVAEIDYSKCVNCGKCINVCPKKVISRI